MSGLRSWKAAGCGVYSLSPLRALRSSSRIRVSAFHSTSSCRRNSKTSDDIETLLHHFRDPKSPFYLAPGMSGPSHPEDHMITSMNEATEGDGKEQGRQWLHQQGFDTESIWEQKIAWGDMDSFQHVNNVKYLRFLENNRISWMYSLGHAIGGSAQADAFIKGKGLSLILRSIKLDFLKPVVFPDTLLIAHKPHSPGKTSFKLEGAIWSCAQKATVATADEVLVWYDYDALSKCSPGEEWWNVLRERIARGEEARIRTTQSQQ